MRYLSTRGGMAPQSFTEILLGGLAPDGGLVVPDRYPAIDAATLESWRSLSYADLAFEVLSRYVDDIDPAVLRDLIARTYTAEVFGSPEIPPLSTPDPGLHLLHPSNGPTPAFQAVALPVPGPLLEFVPHPHKHPPHTPGGAGTVCSVP